ncbi:major facilitator superfamily domain-containing protein [Stachybotrys elegans]|uniref:Major facilitator superfamily domain-containing protein n=1 Tax=Stachybotrys elegans TaxID=80388 RepID=A0A8K0SMW2_9HYPO|nr:major facilitator superfamily domain-containing protein [Stachybotrys elegans]
MGRDAESLQGDLVGEDAKVDERRLIRKLDFFILTFCCFSFFFNHLDRSAFANAYVAGLREELQLEGNQYNVLLAMASTGMLVGQIPSSIMIQKVRPRIWLSSMVVVWAVFTMASAGCTRFEQLAVVRFFMGLAEASTYAGSIYIMGSWYKSDEIAKRAAIFTVAGQVGKMFSGAMMAAIHESMEGHAGLAGWQWVFLIDGIITLPVAIFGFFFFPDIPEITEAFYLSPAERQLALDRLPPKGENNHSIKIWSLAKRVLGQRMTYIFCVFSALSSALQAYIVQGLLILFMKNHQVSDGFTQAQVNTYPIPTHAIGIVVELAGSFIIDRYNNLRVSIGLLLCTIQVVCSVVLLIPDVSLAGHMTVLYLASTAYGINPLMYSWASNIAIRAVDDATRSVMIAMMGASDGLLWTFWGITLYPADQAPYWKTGYIACICVAVALSCWLFVVRWVDRSTPPVQSTVVESLTLETGKVAQDDQTRKSG